MAKQIGSQYDFQKIPIIGLVPEQKTTAPSAPVNGQLWFDSTLNVLKVWEVNQWLLVANTAGGSTPAGPAGGDLTGSSYPNPTIANGAVTLAKMAADSVDSSKVVNNSLVSGDLLARTLVEGNMSLAIIDPTAANAGLRTLGTGATQAAAGNDSRFGAASPPNGAAGGDLTGTYPNPGIAAGVIVLADLAAALTDGTAASQQVRALGAATAQTTFGGAKADGTATTAARSDHVHGTPTHDAAAHSAIPLSALAVPTANVSMNGFNITGLLSPNAIDDAANKGYVDTVAQGLDPKGSVKAATTVNLTRSAPQTVDGISLIAGDRVLVKNQTAQAENGIFVVAAGAWTRATDMDIWNEVPGAFVFVEQGTTQSDTGWVVTADQGGTLNTTAITWAKFSSAGQVIDGAGLLMTGNQLDVGQGNGIVVGTDSISVSWGGNGSATSSSRSDHNHDTAYPPLARTIATTAPLTGGGDLSANRTLAVNAYTGGVNTGVVPTGGSATTYLRGDGTWVTPPAGTTVKFAGLVGALVAGVETLVTHSLGTQDVIAAFRDASTNKAIDFDWRAVSTTQIGITADIAYSANAIRAVVIG